MSTKRTSKVKNGILLAVMICLLIAIVGGTYARYTSSGTASANAEIAKWHIELNGQDISSTSTSVQITAKTVDGVSNNNVAEGKIAPGQTLVAELEVNPTGSEVAVDYIIETGDITATGFDNTSTIEVTKIGAVVEGETNEEFAVNAGGKYTYYQELSDVLDGKSVKFNIYVTWEDGDNTADTVNGTSEVTDIVVPVNIVARQHLDSDGYIVETNDIDNLISTGNVAEGSTVLLTESVDYSETYEAYDRHEINLPDNVTLNLQGKTITTNNSSVTYQGNNITIKNGNFVTPETDNYGISIGNSGSTTGTITDVTVEGGVHVFYANMTLKNVTVAAHKYYAVWGDINSQITIDSGNYTSSSNSPALLGMVRIYEGEDVNENGYFIINGGTFNTNGKKLCLDKEVNGIQQYILPVIYGGTFDLDVSKYVASGYQCKNNGNGTYTVEAQ